MRAAAAFAIVCLLLASGAVIAQEEVPPSPPSPPLGAENAVWDNTSVGTDGVTTIHVRITWEDMPTRDGYPTYNADKTFYPGDALRVLIEGYRSPWYEGTLRCSGAVALTFIDLEREFQRKVDLQIRTDTPAGLQLIGFDLDPCKGTIEVETFLENGSPGDRGIYVDNRRIGTGRGTYNWPQGIYTISFERGPENVRTPPPATVILVPGARVKVTAWYAYENAVQRENTSVQELETGSAGFLDPVRVTLRIRVVPYSPRFVVIPYLWLNWSEGRARSAFELPFAVLVRYDGNRYDPENENRISLEQRAIADGISLIGMGSWPFRSMGDQQRYRDNGELDYYENGDPVMYRDGDVLRYDNGDIKVQKAIVTSAPVYEGSDEVMLFLEFCEENVRERVYNPAAVYEYGGEMLRGVRVHDSQMGKLVKRLPAGEPYGVEVDIYRFATVLGRPIVFNYAYRYHKFVISLEKDARALFENWQGTLSLYFLLWNTTSTIETIRTSVEWSPTGLLQPVDVTAWRLMPWAKSEIENNPRVVYQDNAWRVDLMVSFRMEFVPIYSFENFMNMVRSIAENVGPAFQVLIEENFDVLTPVLENLGIYGTKGRFALFASDAFYSIVNLDEWMMRQIENDAKWSDEPQIIEGRGTRVLEIERRGLPLFALSASAWISPENVQTKYDLVYLPFENKPYEIGVNLSGEGMSVEVVEDTGAKLVMLLHAPSRSGGLQKLRILDNEGKELYSRTFLPASFYRLPMLAQLLGEAPDPYAPQEVALGKTPSTPTEIIVELTNSWGAKYVRKLSLQPYAPEWEEYGIPWKWVVIAGIALVLWFGFVNWLARKRSTARATV